MHVTYRSYLTAGVAAIGAGAIALTPVQPIPNHMALAQERAVSNLAVSLASTIDPITPWVDTIKLSAQNIQSLLGFYLEKPFPLIQTIAANTVTYFGELPDFQQIFSQIGGNIQTFFQAPWSPGACATDPCGDPAFYQGDFISNVPITNKIPVFLPDGLSQRALYAILPGVLPEAQAATLAPLLAFAANHYSGQVAGIVGPLFAPLIELTRSFTAIGAYFEAGDVIGAINELINIPANVTNGVLNGAGYLDLTGVVNAISPLPETIKSIGLNLGGLISPPVPFEGTLAAPTSLNGGTLFDNIAVEAGVGGLEIKSPGLPVSWFGSVIGLGQFLSEAMLVPRPPAPTAAIAAAEAAPAVVETPAVVAEAPVAVVADAPVAVEAPAPAVADDPAPAVAEIADIVEAPAPQVVSAPVAQQQAAASDNNDNAGSGRTSHKGARGKHAS
jgi:hypothetical protein